MHSRKIIKFYKLYFLTKKLTANICHHFTAIYEKLEPLQECDVETAISNSIPNITNKKIIIHTQYFFPFCIFLLITLDNVFLFCQNNFVYSDAEFSELFIHKLFLKQFWSFGDVISIFGIYGSLIIFGKLTFGLLLNPKFVMFAIKNKSNNKLVQIFLNGKPLPADHSEKMYTFYRKTKTLLTYALTSVLLHLEIFFNLQFFKNWKNTNRDYLFLLILPFFFYYITFCNVCNF